MRKSAGLAISALIILGFAGAASAFEPVEMLSGGSNSAESLVPDVKGITREITLAPGQCSDEIVSDLVSLSDRDIYLVSTTGPSRLRVEIEDCCIMGDTICYIGRFRSTCATSPQVVQKQTRFPLPPRTYRFEVGYTDAPGGFPAGYSATVCAD